MIIGLESIRERVEESQDIPTLPAMVVRLLEMFQNPKADASKIAHVICEDQALTTKTLRLANSPFFGFPRPIDSVSSAISILGFNKVRNVVLTASVLETFGRRPVRRSFNLRNACGGPASPAPPGGQTCEGGEGVKDGFDLVGFWEHSLGVAIASEAVARSVTAVEAEDAFICGLLHDMGKLVLWECLEEESAAVRTRLGARGGLMYEAEEYLLGINHGLIGKWMAARWKLPPRLQTVLQFHHDPEGANEGQGITAAVHVADILCRAVDIGYPGDDGIPVLHRAAYDALDLSADLIDKAYKQIFDGLERAGDFLDLIHGDSGTDDGD